MIYRNYLAARRPAGAANKSCAKATPEQLERAIKYIYSKRDYLLGGDPQKVNSSPRDGCGRVLGQIDTAIAEAVRGKASAVRSLRSKVAQSTCGARLPLRRVRLASLNRLI
jgi:hypothetical protein